MERRYSTEHWRTTWRPGSGSIGEKMGKEDRLG